MNRPLLRMGEQFSIYLPVFLMSALALGTWWLVRNAPQPAHSYAQPTQSQSPDYVMRDFAVYQFAPTGMLQSEVRGQVAEHFPQTQTLEVQDIRTHSVNEDGVQTQTSARRGVSNSDASEVQLYGDAKVVRLAQKEASEKFTVESDFLHAWTLEERVESHLPVIIHRGADTFSGDSLRYDNLSQIIEMNGRVKMQINKNNIK